MEKTNKIILGFIGGIIGLSLMAVGASTGLIFLMRTGIIFTTISAWVITWSR